MKLRAAQSTLGATWLRIFMIICGVIVAAGGVAQVYKGAKTMRGADRAELAQVLTESDAALAEGQRLLNEATPAFQRLLAEVDKMGLGLYRTQQKAEAMKTSELIGRSAAQFRLAEQKIEEAKKVNKNSKLKPYLDAKGLSYDRVALSLAVNQEIIAMTLDESITELEVLLPKLQEAAARRDALDKEASVASDESKQLGEQIQSSAKK